MEGLLPSEIARLVLGYLQGESCEEVAKCFLEKSPHLAECLKLSRMGRKFTTKVSGYSLTDILEEFCSVYSIVQEQLSSLPPGNEHLKHGSLADQLKHLFKALCPVQVKITLNSQQNGQNTSNGDAGSEVVTSTPRVRNSRKSISRFQNTLDQNDSCPDPSPAALPPPDATPLESLPGNSDHAVVQNTDCLGSGASNFNQEPKNTPSTANFNEVGTYVDNTTANPKEYNAVGDKQSLPYAAPSAPPVSDTSNQDARTMTAPPPSSAMYTLHEQNVSFTSSFIPAPPDPLAVPGSSSDNSRLRSPECPSKSKTASAPGRKQPEEPAEAVDVSVLKRALLNNPDLQTRLAENINSVILSKDPVVPTPVKTVPETPIVNSATLADVANALDEVIPTIVERTEADPVFERFLEEFFLSDTGKSIDGASATQENVSKSGKKKNTKTSGGKDADASLNMTSTDHFTAPAPVALTPAKLEIEAAVAVASLNPMTPMTSKLINALTNPNAAPPLTDPKQASNNARNSATEMSASEEDCESLKKGGKQRQRKKTKPASSRSKSPGSAKHAESGLLPPLSVEKIQLTNQIMNAFIPIAPRPLSEPLHVTVSDGRISTCTESGQRSWGTYLNENIVLTLNPETVAVAKEVSLATVQSTATVLQTAVTLPTVTGNVCKVVPEPILPVAIEQSQPEPSSSIPPPAPENEAPSTSQEPKKDKPAEPVASRPVGEALLQDISIVGRTPAFQPAGNTRRLSMSTPRRRNSHIRALDFNTPPKDDTQLPRKANTSPKIHKALSPNSSSALAMLSAKRRGELSKEEERNSRAKAHLFTSPEYAMTSSSGFKPSDNLAEEDISGIEAIKEPFKTKAKKAWDADLRASLAAMAPQPPKPKPAAKRKRKVSMLNKPEVDKSKAEPLQKKKKTDTTNLSVVNESTQSDHDLGKLLEENIMNSTANSLNESAGAHKESTSVLEQSSVLDQTSIMSHTTDDSREVSCSVEDGEARTKNPEESQPVESHVQAEEPVPAPAEQSSQLPRLSPKKLSPVTEASNPPQESSLVIPVRSAASLSFLETPVKDYQSAAPPTPSIPSPNTIGQDTPITKLLRAHMPTMTYTAPSPSMPPTPSIKNANEVSPLSAAAAAAAAYFKPSSPARDTVRKAIMADDSMDNHFGGLISNDSLESELIRECNRIEKNKPTPAPTLAKANSSIESSSAEEERSAESIPVEQQSDYSLQPGTSEKLGGNPKNVVAAIFGDDEDVSESSAQIGPLSKDENKSLQEKAKAPVRTAKTKSKKVSPHKISNKKGAKNVAKPKNPPRKTKPLEETEVCSETMRAKLFAMQGTDIEEALNRLHGNADVKYITLLSPLPETPMKDDFKMTEVSPVSTSITPGKAKTPGKSKHKTPLKGSVNTERPLKDPDGDAVVQSKKTPLKLKTPVKLKTPHKSGAHALGKAIDSAKKSTMRVDPNESSSSSSSSSTSSSSSSGSSSDSDSDSSDSKEEESPVKNPSVADVSVHQTEDSDRRPLKASTPHDPTKKQTKQRAEVPHDFLLSPIHNKEAEEPGSSITEEPIEDHAAEKNCTKEDVVIQPKVVEEPKLVKKQGGHRTERAASLNEPLASKVSNETENVEKSSVNEVRASAKIGSSVNEVRAPTKGGSSVNEVGAPAKGGSSVNEVGAPAKGGSSVNEGRAPTKGGSSVNEVSAPTKGGSSVNEVSAPTRGGPSKEVPKEPLTAPSRIATKPTLRQRAARKPVADKPNIQQSKIPSQDIPESVNRISKNVKPDLSKPAKMDVVEDDMFVQRKGPNQRELIGTLQSKERIADKTMDKQNAEDLEEKKRRMISRLKNPPVKGARKKPTISPSVNTGAITEEASSIRRSVDERLEVSPEIQKPKERRSKSADRADPPDVKAAKATDSRSRSESFVGGVPAPEEVPQSHVSSGEDEDTPISELRKGLTKTNEPVATIPAKPAESRTSMPPKQRLKSLNVQDRMVKENQLKQVLREGLGGTKAPPKKRIQKTATGTTSNDLAMKSVVEHDSNSGDEERLRNRHTKAGSDLHSLQHPVEKTPVEERREVEKEVRQNEAAPPADLDSSFNQKKMHVFFDGDTNPSPRKRTDVDLENLSVCFAVTMEDGEEITPTMSVTPLLMMFEMEPASERDRNGHAGGRVERVRHPRPDNDRKEKDWPPYRLKEDRYRKRPRSPSPEYHRREDYSSRERDSRSSSDPRRHQSSSERSQKRVEIGRSPENPRKKPKPGRESAEEGEVTSEDEEIDPGRNTREYPNPRRRRGDRDEWRRHAVEERQRQNKRRKMGRKNEWSSDEGMAPGRSKVDNQRRDEGRKYFQMDSATSRSIYAKNQRRGGRSGDPTDNGRSRHNRNKEGAECNTNRESSKGDSQKQSPSQHVALPPDVESGNSQQSNISTVAVASNSSPENKFASTRLGLSSGKIRTRGGRTNRGHVRTMGAVSRKNNGDDKAPFDINNAQRLLRTNLNVEAILDHIHRER